MNTSQDLSRLEVRKDVEYVVFHPMVKVADTVEFGRLLDGRFLIGELDNRGRVLCLRLTKYL